MVSSGAKNKCMKCVNGLGIVTCNGCQQSLCTRHLSEHRQELLKQLDTIQRDHNLCREDMNVVQDMPILRSRIDTWEKESIIKIQTIAEIARRDLQRLIDENRNELQQSTNNMTNELKTSRENDSFTEIDLKKWSKQLETFRTLLKKPTSIDLVNDNKTSLQIYPIKVKSMQQLNNVDTPRSATDHRRIVHVQQSITLGEENFDEVAGRATLFDDGLMVKTTGYSSICGRNFYSTGTHSIRFRIVTKKNDALFFGVLASLESLSERASEFKSTYGWQNFNRMIIKGRGNTVGSRENNIQTGDELTLTLDCDNKLILLAHHRTKKTVQLLVDTNACPFPWRLLVTSFGEDCVRIIR